MEKGQALFIIERTTERSCQILTPSAPVVKLGRANTTSKELLGARIRRPSFMTMVKGFFGGGNIR
jgi:hypothetical protein